MKTAVIPPIWLDFFWNPAALIALRREVQAQGADPTDLETVKAIYLEMLPKWAQARVDLRIKLRRMEEDLQDLDDLLDGRLF